MAFRAGVPKGTPADQDRLEAVLMALAGLLVSGHQSRVQQKRQSHRKELAGSAESMIRH
jgi:hypothetical protein